MKNFLLGCFIFVSLSNFVNANENFLTLKSFKPYKVIVKRSDVSSNHKFDFFDVSIKKDEDVLEKFESCQGSLVTRPERGYYRIYCKKQKSNLIISGRFLKEDNFRAYWTKENGAQMTFY